MCCRLKQEDYFDSDEEQIKIDYSNEPGNTKSQPPTKKVTPSTETIPLYLLLDHGGINLENIKQNRKVRRKIGRKNIRTIKSSGLEKESSDIRQDQQF